MAMLDPTVKSRSRAESMPEPSKRVWKGRVAATFDHDTQSCRLQCSCDDLVDMCQWLSQDLGFVFATLIVEEGPSGRSLSYIFYRDVDAPWVYVDVALDASATTAPSISGLVCGPSADWHEREAEDLFGLTFAGHPRLGEFVLHEDWPEGVKIVRGA